MRYLNLGCGSRVHSDWENVDFHPALPQVRKHDLRKGIPYPDRQFDVVYHSHVLEHFSKKEAPFFLRECYRVLKTRGILRIAVPDLEQIARMYLKAKEKAAEGVPGWRENYDWMLLEMYDQAVREHCGGSFYDHFRQEPIPNWDFVAGRLGQEAQAMLQAARAEALQVPSRAQRFQSKWSYVLHNLGPVLREKAAKAILGAEGYRALQIARFRAQGEIHQWMYDEYSLTRLLGETGFAAIKRCTAVESSIPNWTGYHLDSAPDGTPHKPDSLYMEAIRS